MIFGMPPLTFVHVVLSLIGILAGFVVLNGMFGSRRLPGWTLVFLVTTIATSVTGFFLPADRILPSHIVGIISLVFLALAVFALYTKQLAAAWRWIYVATATVALYLNVFVLVAQSFAKVPPLHALAPTQQEPPFVIAQAVVLLLFIALGYSAAKQFRPRRIGI
jgi:hypothetical protein